MISKITPMVPLTFLLLCCNPEGSDSDASGTFEATEIIVSSEANGKLLTLNIEEGDDVKRGQRVGVIDSNALYLSKLQLLQHQKAILSGRQNVKAQLEGLRKELDNALADQRRIENLVKGEVASQKQLDDANMRVDVLRARINAQESVLSTTNAALVEQGKTVSAQLRQLEDQLSKCILINPVDGTILVKYTNAHEMTAAGKPIYKIADLTELTLRAYITNDQFSTLKIGQKVNVAVDGSDGTMRNYEGIVRWINDKAEFTPKTIQTRDERANLVYAIKVNVKNDGLLKVGMYGEVLFK
jgi:HlyD family secretion protein